MKEVQKKSCDDQINQKGKKNNLSYVEQRYKKESVQNRKSSLYKAINIHPSFDNHQDEEEFWEISEKISNKILDSNHLRFLIKSKNSQILKDSNIQSEINITDNQEDLNEEEFHTCNNLDSIQDISGDKETKQSQNNQSTILDNESINLSDQNQSINKELKMQKLSNDVEKIEFQDKNNFQHIKKSNNNSQLYYLKNINNNQNNNTSQYKSALTSSIGRQEDSYYNYKNNKVDINIELQLSDNNFKNQLDGNFKSLNESQQDKSIDFLNQSHIINLNKKLINKRDQENDTSKNYSLNQLQIQNKIIQKQESKYSNYQYFCKGENILHNQNDKDEISKQNSPEKKKHKLSRLFILKKEISGDNSDYSENEIPKSFDSEVNSQKQKQQRQQQKQEDKRVNSEGFNRIFYLKDIINKNILSMNNKNKYQTMSKNINALIFQELHYSQGLRRTTFLKLVQIMLIIAMVIRFYNLFFLIYIGFKEKKYFPQICLYIFIPRILYFYSIYQTMFQYRDRSPSFRILTRIFSPIFQDLKDDDFFNMEEKALQIKIRQSQIQRIKFIVIPPELCSLSFPADTNLYHKQEAYICSNYIFIGIEMVMFIPFFIIVLFLGEFEYFPVFKTKQWLFSLTVLVNVSYIFSIYSFSIFYFIKGNRDLKNDKRRQQDYYFIKE